MWQISYPPVNGVSQVNYTGVYRFFSFKLNLLPPYLLCSQGDNGLKYSRGSKMERVRYSEGQWRSVCRPDRSKSERKIYG